jgi:lysozyme
MNFDIAVMRDELIRDESIRLKPYLDCCGKLRNECKCPVKGKLTIGIGRNLDDVGISRVEAIEMNDADIYRAAGELDMHLNWWQQLDPVRQRVMLNMCFNLGIDKLIGFKNTLAKIKSGDYQGAADGMLQSLWARQVGDRAKRLAELMRRGS